jgi:elongation factor P
MFPATKIREGMILLFNDKPHRVESIKRSMAGRGSAHMPTKLKNLLDGSVTEYRFRSDDKVERAFISEEKMEFLYSDGDEYVFMNNETYEQISLRSEDIGDAVYYLLPNTECTIQMYEHTPVGVSLPTTVAMTVQSTEPVVKGATASGNVPKPAEMETGLKIQVPMFIKQGEKVLVNTTTGEYAGRANA